MHFFDPVSFFGCVSSKLFGVECPLASLDQVHCNWCACLFHVSNRYGLHSACARWHLHTGKAYKLERNATTGKLRRRGHQDSSEEEEDIATDSDDDADE